MRCKAAGSYPDVSRNAVMAKKATNGVIVERVKALKTMILTGSSNSVCVGFAAESWGVSSRTTYRLLKRAWESIHDDIAQVGIDRR